jgi:hypothetical protein
MKSAAGNDKRKQSKSHYIAAPLHNREQPKVPRSLLMANDNHENVSSSGELGQSTSIITITRTRSNGRVAPELEEEDMCANTDFNVLSRTGNNFMVRFAEPLVTNTTFTDRPHASNMSAKDKKSMFYSPQELRVLRIKAAIRRDAAAMP